MIYSREYETMAREDLEQLQVERLQITLNQVYRNVKFFKTLFDDKHIDISEVKSLEDLSRLPLTTKEDLKHSYPYEAFAVPLRDIVRIHSTSGTTGNPIVVGYTKNDLNIWSSLVGRVLSSVGIDNNHLVQIAFDYSQSTGGLGFHYGAEKLGASVIPASGEQILKQIKIMKDYRSSALISTPGYALHIASELEALGIDPHELNLSIGLFGAEPWSEKMRSEIESKLKIKAFDNYGLSEIIGPGVAYECECRCGMHVNEDHFIVEVINPDTLEVLPEGEEGELVFTTVTKQAFPLIRYRTGDISKIIPGSCDCSRTFRRIERVSGRIDDMLIIDGNNIFPSRIEELLFEIEGVEPHFQIILSREKGTTMIELKVEISPDFFSIDEIRRAEDFRKKITNHMSTRLGLRAKITLVEPKSIGRSSGGKVCRVVDLREDNI
ncbi:MAG: phenylacetate--CoA ligase [Spirochaetales bacterium]|uniref:Phenylacetate-coenzyme A ligase n=1 Tax=Candidatus Thalassospirochaeta sargassi TaxID=3119039 RepID=A0AAJ1IFQ7_9SPIO|nr:phenylacetate--CoA ligase [Spirochaetales bacterium]